VSGWAAETSARRRVRLEARRAIRPTALADRPQRPTFSGRFGDRLGKTDEELDMRLQIKTGLRAGGIGTSPTVNHSQTLVHSRR